MTDFTTSRVNSLGEGVETEADYQDVLNTCQ
jgi:hypothetical protein